MKYTTNARSILKQVLSNSSLGILSMVDSPCGSFHWMPSVIADFPHIQYTGIDIACSVIEGNVLKHRYHSNMKFYCLDMCHQEIPQADLVFSRDALQHLPFEFVFGFLAILKKSGAKWALLGGYPLGPGNLVGARMENGDFFPIDLTRPPFNVTGVVKVFSENSEDVDKKHLFLIDVANMKWSRFNS